MMKHHRAYLCVLIGLTLVSAWPACAQVVDSSLFSGMKWRMIGPFRGGRVSAVAGIAGNPNVYYFGAAAGGVWKTSDGGLNWTPIFDDQSVSSIGSIAVAASNPNVIYVGTGEACIRNDVSFGNGVYKSTDGGKTWKNVGLKDSRHIGRVLVDPQNPSLVFVAVLGHAYGPNSGRGVFRSRDGGKTWEKVLYLDDNTGAIDVTLDPNNSNILFAALWEVRRTPWSLISGGLRSGLYRSSDGGTTWRRLEGHGLPHSPLGRIGVAVARADSNCVYAMIEAEHGGLFRSDDGGEEWTQVNSDYSLRARPWYFSHVFTDPKNAAAVYVFTVNSFRSTDGGKSFALMPAVHVDHHDLWIDPENPQRMIAGDDGGATISTDGGKHWSPQDNQPTAQFYHIATDNRFHYRLYGAQQDRGTVAIASRTDHGAIDRADWHDVGGGESGYVCPRPPDFNLVYASASTGVITVFDERNGQIRDISPWPANLVSLPAVDAEYRLGWTPPMLISPNDPNILYVGAQVLFKNINNGQNWTIISPDLTRNDRNKQLSSGGPITQDNTGAEYYDTLSTIAESPLHPGLIWAGSDDGLIHLTRDGGGNWLAVTPTQLPAWSNIGLIEPSPHAAGRAYVGVDRHRLDDFRPYIYKTADYGKNWELISGSLPDVGYVHAVREDPQRDGLLYAGTETGIYISFDDGAHWQSLQLNLPRTPIYDLTVHDSDLVVATHGRSFWILDDLSPLRQINEQISRSTVHLYQPSIAYRINTSGIFSIPPLNSAGANPPQGAVIDYYLRSIPEGRITLEVLDDRGNTVRRYSRPAKREEHVALASDEDSLPDASGMVRFVWDLRYAGPTHPQGSDSAGPYGVEVGPLAPPGIYHVRLMAAGRTQSTPLEIKLDPRVQISSGDLQKQFQLAIEIRNRLSKARQALSQMHELYSQLDFLRKRLSGHDETKEIVDFANALARKVLHVEEGITGWKVERGRYWLNYPPALDDDLQSLFLFLETADGAPSDSYIEVSARLAGRLDVLLAQWHDIEVKDLAALNNLIRQKQIPAISSEPFR
jgi:photosystem II stability/assembly factor-like uncharacterized protein